MDLTTREQIEALLGAYRQAELAILGMIAEAADGSGTEAWFRGQHRQLERLIRRAERLLAAAHPTPGQIRDVLANGYAEGVAATVPPGGAPPTAVSAPAVSATVTEIQGALESAGATILRETRDIYRRVAQQAAQEAIVSGADNRRMIQRIIDEYANRGITGFTDRAGRRWGIDTYAEMVLRTAVNRAQNEGRLGGYRAQGVSLVKTSQHIGSHPWCIPWQNKVLAVDGYAGSRTVMNNLTGHEVVVEVAGTLQEAIAAGYHHPNAILGGDQLIDTLGEAVGASKGTYRGPAVTVRTAKGHWFTVSPEHPVLTSRGWRTAESLRAGDDLFSTVKHDRGHVIAPSSANTNIDNVVPTVEDTFVALETAHGSHRAPASNNFDDDRRFLQGEINVVTTNNCLTPVPDPQVVKETGEVVFVWPGVVHAFEVGGGSSSDLLGGEGFAPDVVGSLADCDTRSRESTADCGIGCVEHGGDLLARHSTLVEGDHLAHGDGLVPPLDGRPPSSFKPSAYGRRGDSQNPADVCEVVPGLVEADSVVEVEFSVVWCHAYDFQTVDGVYLLNGVIVHNCRHTDTAFVPWLEGEEDIQTGEEEYEAEQRQREIERNIRRWKRRRAGSFNERSNTLSEAKIRVWQEEQRHHLEKYPWLTRRYDRERLWYQSTRKGGRN